VLDEEALVVHEVECRLPVALALALALRDVDLDDEPDDTESTSIPACIIHVYTRGTVEVSAKVNSAFYPSVAGKSSRLPLCLAIGLKRGAFTCVEWQVASCDDCNPIWQVTLCSYKMG